jgi:hypothetical protein
LSANYAHKLGSAFYFWQHFNLSLHFCTFSGDAPANCLFFGNDIASSYISCLSLTNNSCQSDPEFPGFICVSSPLTLLSCVFQGNTFDYFLGSSTSDSSAIGFINCVFDIESLNRTGTVSFSTTGCVYETQPTFLADCHSRTRTASPSPTRTASLMPTRTASRTPIQTANPTASQLRCLEAGDPITVVSCCEKAPDTNDCTGLLPACMSLALKGEYSADWTSEHDQLETCRAYCNAVDTKPAWCSELPGPRQAPGSSTSTLGAVIGVSVAAGVVLLIAIAVIVVCCRKKHKTPVSGTT